MEKLVAAILIVQLGHTLQQEHCQENSNPANPAEFFFQLLIGRIGSVLLLMERNVDMDSAVHPCQTHKGS